MRLVPIVLIVLGKTQHGSKDERIHMLTKEVLKTGTVTHHSILGIVPAFSFAYLLMKWLESGFFRESSFSEQMSELAFATEKFETKIGKEEFFTHRAGFVKDHVHSYSRFLKHLSNMKDLKNSALEPERRLYVASKIIKETANKFSTHPVQTMNDGIAIASVTSSIVAAILLKDKPFLGVLQHVYRYGGDTDTVGAMVGALLGAHIGCSGKRIDPKIANHIICHEHLFAIFKLFMKCTRNEELRKSNCSGFDMIELEKSITMKLISVPNGQRNPHYNSTTVDNPHKKNYNLVLKEVKDFLSQIFMPGTNPKSLEAMIENLYVRSFLQPDIIGFAQELTEQERLEIFQRAWRDAQYRLG